MDIYNSIQCLLDKRLISASYAATLQKYAAILPMGSTTSLFALAGLDQGAPSMMESETANNITVTEFTTPLEGVVKVVATAFDDDAYHTVTADGDPTSDERHVLKEGINYTFTPAEWKNFRFVAATGSTTIAATFYK